MLFENLYRIEYKNQVENGILFHLTFNPDHAIYQGHFPGQPVTPGVVQMHIVKELLEQHLDKTLKTVTVAQCKFLNIHDPEKQPSVSLSLQITSKDEGFSVAATCTTGETSFFKLNATYK